MKWSVPLCEPAKTTSYNTINTQSPTNSGKNFDAYDVSTKFEIRTWYVSIWPGILGSFIY